MNLTRIATKIFNKPLLIDEVYMATFLAALGDKLDISEIEMSSGEVLTTEQAYSNGGDRVAESKPYQVSNGTAIISVAGTLVNKNGNLKPQSGMHGYDGIEAQFCMAMDDPSVNKILMDIDSYGGEVAGCFDLCDLIYGFRGEKESIAFVGEHATSAAYALASSCGSVYTPRTGALGSIGVLVAHQEMSKRMESEGVKVTLIHSGKHKVDGNPYEELSTEVREKIQGRIDSTRQLFAETVARNRGMSVADVLATEAAVFEGAEAVQKGLADAVMSFNEVIQTMINEDVMEAPVVQGAIMEDQESAAVVESQEFDPVAENDYLDAKAIAEMCNEKSMDYMIAGLLDGNITADELAEQIAETAELRDLLTAQGFDSAVITAVEKSDSKADVARAIFDATAEDEDIAAHIPDVVNKESASSEHDFYKFQS